MRLWQIWWRSVVVSSQYYSPRLIELVMLLLAMALLVIWGSTGTYKWPYLVLSLSYVIGASVSILVRESLIPSPRPRLTQVTAVLLLIISLYSFADLARLL
ncbi:MAG: hypothetical protein NVS2B14_11100 [Chamaesiphon sp.]